MPKISEADLILNSDKSVYHLNLKPEHIADDIITVGDPSRVHRISSFFDKVEFEMNRREFITHTGTYKGKRITVISTGMGTDNVEILLTELDALVNVDLKKREVKEEKKSLNIIRVGTSGGIQEDIKIGSHLVSEYAVGLDTLMFFYEYQNGPMEDEIATQIQKEIGFPFKPYVIQGSSELMKKFGEGMIVGNTITAPGFYAPQGRVLRNNIKFPNLIDKLVLFHHRGFWLTNFEMETAGYYALANMMGHKMISLNAILANRVKNTFSKNPNRPVDALIKKVLERI